MLLSGMLGQKEATDAALQRGAVRQNLARAALNYLKKTKPSKVVVTI